MTAYFCRLQAGTAAGLTSAPLAIPQLMQYYEVGNWVLNKEDQCTQLFLANQGFTFLNPSHTFDAATRELNLGGGPQDQAGVGKLGTGWRCCAGERWGDPVPLCQAGYLGLHSLQGRFGKTAVAATLVV